MTTTALPTLVRIEDRDGLGVCTACGREGVRWIAVLTDGSQVGAECAKKVMGWKPAPKSYIWAEGFRPVAEYRETPNVVHTLWENAGGHTRSTTNGALNLVGGARGVWKLRGWL